MKEIVNNLLLAGDKPMPELHLRQDLYTVLADHLQKATKEYKNLKKQGIHDIFIKMN